MGIITTGLTYSPQESLDVYVDVLYRTKIVENRIFTPIPGVKNSIKIPSRQKATVLQAPSCTFTPDGDIILTEKEISVNGMKVNEEMCAADLEARYNSAKLKPNRPTEMPEDMVVWWVDSTMEDVSIAIERLAYLGDTLSANPNLARTDGLLKLIAADASSTYRAEFTGSIATTTLTVSVTTKGVTEIDNTVQFVKIGMVLVGSGITAGTTVLEQLTGDTGQIGTYRVSVSQTAASTTITASTVLSALNLFEASQSTTVLTVSNVIRGQLRIGQIVTGTGWAANTIILAQLTGETGGNGTYTVSTSGTVTSRIGYSKFSTVTTNNVLYVIQDIYNTIPAGLELMEDWTIVVPLSWAKFLRQFQDSNPLAVNDQGITSTGTGKDIKIFIHGMPIEFSQFMPVNESVASFEMNLFMPMDIPIGSNISDVTAIQVFAPREGTRDDTYGLIADLAVGFNYRKGQYIVKY